MRLQSVAAEVHDPKAQLGCMFRMVPSHGWQWMLDVGWELSEDR